ncbi:protein TANC2 isoform X1 [Acyrthosiphon pisum]|uniref:RING-type domain-containing protein n=1 Tax=Acyrthosiphon pisum TaxID=7029 RepID=A0A8R1WZ14_ACYPI|nr:protein TANC2 isoform X1 [Acyrthosiphon pisum]|eukprot:XP_008179715.1 PREDICTED: protein TANC2 isoform X2 [Acyrthosiphon pisum]
MITKSGVGGGARRPLKSGGGGSRGGHPRPVSSGLSFSVLDLAAIRKLLEEGDGDETCPSCGMPFDKGKKRKLIDSCGHERCYACMFRNEGCPLCATAATAVESSAKASKKSLTDEPIYVQNTRINRPRVKTNGHFSPYVQSRQGSQELSHSPSRLPRPNRNLEEVMTQSCPTPPQSRRKFFLSPKTIRNQWSMRSGSRSPSDNALSVMSASTSTVTSTDQRRWSSVVLGKIRSLWSLRDDEGGNVKPRGSLNQRSCNSDTLYTRLGLLLSRDSNSRSFTEDVSLASVNSKPVSSNGSPVSTLTGSSETEHKAIKEQSSDSIGSLMSMSGQSNGSCSPLTRRHSVTTLQAGSVDDLRSFRTRRQPTRRSARSGTIKGPIDPKVRFAQYRTSPQQQQLQLQQQQQQQLLVLKPLFFEVPQQESDPLFLGREWLVQDISRAMLHAQSSGVAVTGLPGTGKTAFVLQLVEHSCFGRLKSNVSDVSASQSSIVSEDVKSLASRVVAYHFCQADNNSTCLIPEFVHSLAAQLCQAPQLNMYRQHVLTELNLQDSLSMRECIVDPDAAFTRGVLEPLNALSRLANTIGTGGLVIVIDGLCEAEYHRPDHGDTIASFLVKHMPKFPAWLKVIATLRTNLEDALPPLPLTKICVDVISANKENVIKDMMDYISFRVTNSASIQNNLIAGTTGQLKFCQHLQAASDGSFLFAKLTLDLIERGHLVAKSQSFKVLPVTLAQIYQLHFNLRFPTTSSFEKVADILSVCLAALYPLTILEIYYSVNSLNVDEFVSWEAFLQRFKLISGLLIKRLDNTYMFFHPSFREWLMRREDGESKKFVCDLRNGHSGIALRFSRLQAPLDSEKTLELGHHILKAHLYKNVTLRPLDGASSRDLQANWLASVSSSVSSALCSMRNTYAPNVKVSRLLLLAGASPDVRTDMLGRAPAICVYAHEGVYDMVAVLLEFGASVNVSNSQGRTPLWMAASRGHIDVVKLLIEAGASPGLTDSAGRCPLVEAAKNGRFNVVAYLSGCEWTVTDPRAEVDHADASQQALVQASGCGVDDVVEYLLDVAEVTVDGQDSLSGETALTLASSNGHKSTVVLLIDRGAQVSSANVKCMNALALAARDGQWEVVETLLHSGTHVDIVDSEQRTPLMMAASEDHSGIVELLLDSGADLSAEDRQGQTSLSWACLKGRVAIAQYLLDRGAPIDHADKSGKTALDLATLNGNPALVQLLLERGALIEHVDLYGMRPLDRAISCRNVPVVQNFLRRGAKLGPTTWNMASGKPDIMLVLLNKLLEDGNTLYRKGRLKEAAYRYTYALNKFPPENELDSTFKQLQINFYLNTSRCKRKLNEVHESVEFAEKVLKLKPTSFEAYYARAKALKDLRRYDDALTDIQEAVRLVPSGNSDIRHVLFRLKDDIQSKLALDHTALNQEIAGPSYL